MTSGPDPGAEPAVALGRAAARGAATLGLAQAVRIGLQVASVVILTRLLQPEDFGIFAMAWGVLGVAELFRDMGLQAAATRAKVLTSQQSSNIFWLSLLLGLGFAGLTVASAPLLAHLFSNASVGLVAVWVAPAFILSGAAAQFRVLLVRSLRFGVVSAVEAASAALGLLAGVIAASAGAGYWSLVTQLLTSGLVGLTGFVGAARWRPRAPQRGHGTRSFVSFGGAVLLSQILTYAMYNLDSAIVGYSAGDAAAGYYNRGAQIVRSPLRQLHAPFATVAVPVLSRMERGDPRVAVLLQTGQSVLAVPIFLTATLCAAVSQDIVRVMLGPGWEPAAPILALIAVATALQVVGSTGSWAMVAHGEGKYLAWVSGTTAAISLGCMIVGVNWGPVGVAWGAVVGSLLNIPVNLAFVRRAGQVPTLPLLSSAVRLTLVCIPAGAAARALSERVGGASAVATVLMAAAVCVGVVAVAAVVWRPFGRDVAAVRTAVRMARAR